jgi:hypothetical protein
MVLRCKSLRPRGVGRGKGTPKSVVEVSKRAHENHLVTLREIIVDVPKGDGAIHRERAGKSNATLAICQKVKK